jgi:hypothetical protein
VDLAFPQRAVYQRVVAPVRDRDDCDDLIAAVHKVFVRPAGKRSLQHAAVAPSPKGNP